MYDSILPVDSRFVCGCPFTFNNAKTAVIAKYNTAAIVHYGGKRYTYK